MVLLDATRFLAKHPLTRDRLPSAIGRVARWQMASRFWQGDLIVDWVNGARLIARRGETAVTGNIYCGLYEFEPMAYVLHVMRQSDVFVDAGANVGTYTILACACGGATGYAFEPVQRTHARLLRNVRLNDLEQRVHCFNMGLGAAPGELRFTDDQDDMNHVVASGGTPCQVARMDDVLAGVTPNVIKMDVEGFELAVLEGAEQTLSDRRLHSVLVEVNGMSARYGYKESTIFDLMARHGFEPHAYDPHTRSLRPSMSSYYGIVLFVRDLPLVRESVRTGPIIEVHEQRI